MRKRPGKYPPRRLRRKCEDNIKTDFREIGSDDQM
jgi:hypothetical protein